MHTHWSFEVLKRRSGIPISSNLTVKPVTCNRSANGCLPDGYPTLQVFGRLSLFWHNPETTIDCKTYAGFRQTQNIWLVSDIFTLKQQILRPLLLKLLTLETIEKELKHDTPSLSLSLCTFDAVLLETKVF